MLLHEDKDVFYAILQSVSSNSGIPDDILEKDYYVTLMLAELANKQTELPAYFKGGTALYKIIGEDRRFSEDIDLTVDITNFSTSKGKRMLEKAANGYTTLPRTQNKNAEENRKGSITSVYTYDSVVSPDLSDRLQRFGTVKVEATSFTTSDPHSNIEVSALIYSNATEEQKMLLRDRYGIYPFLIDTMTMERIFADKIVAIEFCYVRNMLGDVAKHMYDVATMMQFSNIKEFISNSNQFYHVLTYKWEEETARIGSDLSGKPFADYRFFKEFVTNPNLKPSFDSMQEVYVFEDKYFLEYRWVCEQLQELYSYLQTVDKVGSAQGISYTLDSLQSNPSTLMKVMEKHWDYAAWFNDNFPNGAPSMEAVLEKLKQEG